MSKEVSFVPFVHIHGINRVRTSVSLLNAREATARKYYGQKHRLKTGKNPRRYGTRQMA
jgi:hypothetical protein